MKVTIDTFKKWLEDNKELILCLVAKNYGTFQVSSWGVIGSDPNWPCSTGLEQDEAFNLQFINGCMNGFAVCFGEEFNVYEFFHDEYFVPYMKRAGFEFLEGEFDRCDHKWDEYENERVGRMTYCTVCGASHPVDRPDLMFIPPGKGSHWQRINAADKKSLKSNID